MTSKAKEKGDELEDAVSAIEGVILHTAPTFEKGTFNIQSNKIVIQDGVKQEIDIYVTAQIATGYEATFIFECKNWEAKVGKNEIIIFSQKITVTGAQTGFFVAKSFTRDARAQAKLDPRIDLLIAKHFIPVDRLIFPRFHLLNIVRTDAKVNMSGFNDKGKRKEIPLAGKTFKVKGEDFEAVDYLTKIIEHARSNKLSRTPTVSIGEGLHTIEFNETVEFEEGDTFLEKTPIRAFEILGQVEIEVTFASVLSVYDVESRGRAVMIGASGQGIEVKAQFVELQSPPDKGQNPTEPAISDEHR